MKLLHVIAGLLTTALLSWSVTSKAENKDLWVNFGAVSEHFQSRPGGYNEEHKFFAINYNNWTVGCFENSNYDESCFVFKNYLNWDLEDYVPIKQAKYIDFGYACGVASGYEELSVIDLGFTNITGGCLFKSDMKYENVGIDFYFGLVVVALSFKVKF